MRSTLTGLLLAGLLVGMSEGMFLAFQPRWPRFATGFELLAPPAVLWVTAQTALLHVSLGVWIMGIIVVTYLTDNLPTALVGGALLAFGGISSEWLRHDATHWLAWDAFWLLGSMAVIPWLRRHLLWVGLFGLSAETLAAVFFNGDPAHDFVISIVTGVLVLCYVALRNAREHTVRETEHLANHDALTGALTRHGLQAWRAQWGKETPWGVIVLADLDDFKWVNDTWGHDVGDWILRQFAERLQTSCRETDRLVRSGGDEFQIWMPMTASTTASAAAMIARCHHATVAEPFQLRPAIHEGDERAPTAHLGVSMGWALGPLGDATVTLADQALLQAKRTGKNRWVSANAWETPAAPGAPEFLARFPETSIELGWLADAAHSLWSRFPLPAVLTNLEGHILFANQAYAAMNGSDPAALVGVDTATFGAGRTPDAVYKELWNHLRRQRPWHGSLENRRPDGSTWWAEETITPVVLGDRVAGYWATVTDLSDPQAVPGPAATSILDGTLLTPVFQPIWDLRTGRLLGHEALIRPSRGDVPLAPTELFNLAERTGQSAAVDLACLATVVDWVRERGGWHRSDDLFVNINPRTLADSGFQSMYPQLAALVPGGHLIWEITERGSDPAFDWAKFRTEYLDSIWAIDDFGKGDADVYRLLLLRPTWIKIDRKLVELLPRDEVARQLVDALSKWAHQWNGLILAEGCETSEAVNAARRAGADAAQGFWLGRPEPHLVSI